MFKNGGHPTLYKVEPAVKTYLDLNTTLYKVFIISKYVQDCVDRMNI